MMPYVIGLTGQTGSGKSTVAKSLCKELSAEGIDCDQISRVIVQPGMDALQDISNTFGKEYILTDNSLNRKKLGELVFSNKDALEQLNSIMYPRIREVVTQKILACEEKGIKWIILDAPTLFEAELEPYCDKILSVVTDFEQAVHRIMERDCISKEVATARLQSQHDKQFFQTHSDFIIENNGSLEQLKTSVSEIVQKIRERKDTKMEAKELKEKLFCTSKHGANRVTEEEKKACDSFSKDYIAFLNASKTEREANLSALAELKKNGFVPFEPDMKLSAGDKIYVDNRGKAVIAAVIGTAPITEGVHLCAAHIDSPRLDLKQNPLYEDHDLALFKTHYYGGIKKYQWTAIPLALHGVVVLADGTKKTVNIGEDENDPVFCVTDLLPHLAQEQYKRPATGLIKGEELNILVGSMPFNTDKESEQVKLNILNILHEKYGMTETDFLSAELEAVPAFPAKELGLDRSMIGGYGHDDRVCAYPALRALTDCQNPTHTVVVVLTDKEETGSDGNTGLCSSYLPYFLEDLADCFGAKGRHVMHASKCLSADVNAAFDPTFPDVMEQKNCAYLNYGVCVTKFTGARGKSGTSDASAEFVGTIRSILDEKNVVWQTGELGKVDGGGGGTVAAYIANLDIDTIDVGVPVLSMHAPFEVVSKLDVYMTYRAFSAFMEA